MNAFVYLIGTLFDLYLMAVILRFLLQLVKADFYNPFSQFIVKITNPVLRPLRRLVPGVGGIDWSAVIFAIVLAGTKVAVLSAMVGARLPAVTGLLMYSPLAVISALLSLMFWVLIVRAILSWISQGRYNPFEMVLHQLSEPILAPIRRVIPPLGGLDLSVLVAIIALQFVQYLLRDMFGPIF